MIAMNRVSMRQLKSCKTICLSLVNIYIPEDSVTVRQATDKQDFQDVCATMSLLEIFRKRSG
jgi:hypothetical protein